MATPYSNPSTQKPYNVLIAGFFLLLTINMISAQTTSFSYTNFTDDGSLILQGDAKIWADGILALPTDPSFEWTTSRVLYATPVTLWDSTTGNVASFVTSFSFVVSNFKSFNPADGLVFFLAPWGTDIPSNSDGGRFGIVNGNSSYNKFVAVEFDSFIDTVRDPDYEHIGIDVSSLISFKTVKWNRVSRSIEKVSIIYDSLIKTLTVAVTHSNSEITTLSQVVNLKNVLPEKVSVGFSATTSSSARERHDILSWSFTSNLTTNGPTENINNIASYAA